MALPSSKPRRRPVLRLVALALALYIFLMIPWPGVEPGYAYLFRAGGNLLFTSVVEGRGGKVAFERLDDPDDSSDTLLRIGNYRTGKARKAKLSSRYMGYTSAALVTALILATPMTRSRKLWALGLGLLLVHCFVALRVGLKLVHLGRFESVALFTFGPWSNKIFSVAHHLLVTIPEAKFVVTPIIWVLVCFRREDLAAFTRSAEKESPSVPSKG